MGLEYYFRAVGSSKKQGGGATLSSEKHGGENLEIDLANHNFFDEIDKIYYKQESLFVLRPCVCTYYSSIIKGKSHTIEPTSIKRNFSMSKIVLILFFILSLSTVNSKKRRKDTGCDFCNEYLGRSSDESG